MKKENKEIRCPRCKTFQPQDEIYDRVDPYQKEINNIEVIEEMCNQCEEERRDLILFFNEYRRIEELKN